MNTVDKLYGAERFLMSIHDSLNNAPVPQALRDDIAAVIGLMDEVLGDLSAQAEAESDVRLMEEINPGNGLLPVSEKEH